MDGTRGLGWSVSTSHFYSPSLPPAGTRQTASTSWSPRQLSAIATSKPSTVSSPSSSNVVGSCHERPTELRSTSAILYYGRDWPWRPCLVIGATPSSRTSSVCSSVKAARWCDTNPSRSSRMAKRFRGMARSDFGAALHTALHALGKRISGVRCSHATCSTSRDRTIIYFPERRSRSRLASITSRFWWALALAWLTYLITVFWISCGSS